jgi:MFS family permease
LKNNTALRFLYTANAVSGFAQGISMLAVPWYFNSRSDAGYFNAAYGVITLLVIFWGLYAGSLVDRFPRKSVFMMLNLSCGIVFSLVALGGYMYGSTHPLLILSVFGITMFNYNIHYPALYALGHEITPPESYSKFNSYIEVVGQSVSVLSGGLAAMLLDGMLRVSIIGSGLFSFRMPFTIAAWRIEDIILFNAVAHFVACAFIYFIKYTPLKVSVPDKGVLWERLSSGFKYLNTKPEVLLFGLASYSVFAMLLVEVHAVLPGYIDRYLHQNGSVFALADTVYAVGALAAGLGVRHLFKRQNPTLSIIILTLIICVFFIWHTFAQDVWVTLFLSIVLGFANAGIRILRLTYLFKHIPNELMGRVNSIFNMANVLTRALFIFLFTQAFFANGSEIRWAYFIMGVFLLGSASLMLVKYNKLRS